ncbi:MAG: nuclear transport factor 2 family protein, partial [Halobacteriales archaeon]|nr:nuclear transport factor 2 family protein [Halobacteriales archaeon]
GATMVDREMILEQYRREVTPDLYDEIRELYKAHSVAEDNRDIDGLLATLTADCVYEMPQSGHRWEGHEGAERFYTELLGAFPDIDFRLRNIVIGPQGVFEEADVSGTRKGEWLGVEPDDETVEFRVLIFFPWDLEARRFRGEVIYVDSGDPTQVAAG